MIHAPSEVRVVRQLHVVVTVPHHLERAHDALELCLVLGREGDVHRRRVLLEALQALGARDREHVRALRVHPGEAHLAGGVPPLLREGPDGLPHLGVVVEVLLVGARLGLPPVLLREIRLGFEGPREHPAAQGGVGDDPDPELPADRHDVRLEIAGLEAPLLLHAADGAHLVGASDDVRWGLGEPHVLDLALRDELLALLHGLLDGRVGVQAVLVEEIDVPAPELSHAVLVAGADRGWGRV
mmetsp:Transcript_10380/g.33571  ORF Transcript_10380/g.33571 Transcript_10380/m.33571 type:complete len:241 (-) Transcript_10380:47-769(-)